MERRKFITGLGGVLALPLATRAQQAMPVVGLLRSTPSGPFAYIVAAVHAGLKEGGFIDGKNVVLEQRWAEGKVERLPALAAELIRRNASVLICNNVAASAAKAATKTVPIVFITGSDPIQDGLVTSLNRPGGNITGVSFLTGTVGTKRLEILRQVVPNKPIALLVHPNFSETEAERRSLSAAALSIGQKLLVIDVASGQDVDAAFASMAERGAGSVIVGTGAYLNTRRVQIVALAARHKIPAIYPLRESVVIGGLMSYGASQDDAYRQGAVYAARILKGEKPADLPVAQSSKFEFVINLETAKALGLQFHPQLLATADEVIE